MPGGTEVKKSEPTWEKVIDLNEFDWFIYLLMPQNTTSLNTSGIMAKKKLRTEATKLSKPLNKLS